MPSAKCEMPIALKHRREIVHLLVKFPIHGTKHILETGPGDVLGEAPSKGQLKPASVFQVPLFHCSQQSLEWRFSLLFGRIRHHDQEFVAALSEDQVAAAKYFLQYAAKVGKHAIPFHAP